MAPRVTETCRWLLCNKITFINPSAFAGLFKKMLCFSEFVLFYDVPWNIKSHCGNGVGELISTL